MEEKSGLPTIAAINGVNKSAVNAVTTPPKAAPITTPTAISTTLPRKINCLKPDNITFPSAYWNGRQCKCSTASGQAAHDRNRFGNRCRELHTRRAQIRIGITIYRYL